MEQALGAQHHFCQFGAGAAGATSSSREEDLVAGGALGRQKPGRLICQGRDGEEALGDGREAIGSMLSGGPHGTGTLPADLGVPRQDMTFMRCLS